ncbi:MAG: VWA-like domain-containing protein [Marinovum sp.]|nr:VWA-like domain-containing protein [Marinovum sp.]
MPEVDPAIAALALWCQHRDDRGPTRTEGDTIYYGPEFPLLPISEQTGLLAHHVCHVALRHAPRKAQMAQRMGQGFQPDLYALAADGLINEALLQAGHALPRPAVRASEIVALLPLEERPKTVLSAWDCDQFYLALIGRLGSGGQGASGAAQSYAKARGFEDDIGAAAPEESQQDIWAGRMTQALAVGQRAGGGIGAVLAQFADLPLAGVPWEVHLRRKLRQALFTHRHVSFQRPSRSWLARDAFAVQQSGPRPVFEPGWRGGDRRLRLVVGLDTSSSIPEATLALFAAEALSAVRKSGAEAHLLGFDTEVHHRSNLDRANSLQSLTLRRGGGTDFDCVLEEAQGLDPSLIVLLTDLEGEVAYRPKAPLIWAVPEPPQFTPRLGDVLVMRG